MSDTADAAPAEAPAEAPAADTAPAAAPETTSAAPAEAAEPDPFDGDLPDEPVFSRGYVEKLRKQGQNYRTQAQEAADRLSRYDEVYGQYDPEDQKVWLDMASEWARDPRSAADMMQRIAQAVLDEGKTPEEATEQVVAEDSAAADVQAEAAEQGYTLTPEQVQQMVDERLEAQRQQQNQEAAVQQIFDEIKNAGYEPRSRDGQAILWTANNETDGDIAKAIEIHKAERQKIIDDYIADKKQPSARPAPSDGVLASEHSEPRTLEEADAAVRAFLKGQSQQAG